MRVILVVTALMVLAVSLAGCTGDFRVRQTEPIRVQVDGGPEEARVASSDSESDAEEKSEFRIESPQEIEMVMVVVEVTPVIEGAPVSPTGTPENTTGNQTPTTGNETSGAVVVLVIVEDRDTDERLAEERVEAGEQSTQVELDVDVKGRNNVIIVTQAVQGVADVSVAAMSASGGNTTTSAATTTTSVTD